MKKTVTLKKNHEFRRIYRQGSSAVGGSMVVYCRKNRGSPGRLGVTVSTRIGNAVKRNRARRRLREVYRLHADALLPGYDVILVARTRTLTASWEELNRTYERLCKKLGFLRSGSGASGSGASGSGTSVSGASSSGASGCGAPVSGMSGSGASGFPDTAASKKV